MLAIPMRIKDDYLLLLHIMSMARGRIRWTRNESDEITEGSINNSYFILIYLRRMYKKQGQVTEGF
jgi:hypothetical protein